MKSRSSARFLRKSKSQISMFNAPAQEGSLYSSDEYYSENEGYGFQPQNRHAKQSKSRDPVEQLVFEIFAKYDNNRNGFLEKNEVLKLLDEIL